MINDVNNDNSNRKKNNEIKKIPAFKKKISHLRFFVYVLMATSVLMLNIGSLWLYSNMKKAPFDTYYSKSPNSPKGLLYLSPREGNYNVGDEFPVDVLLNTAGSNVVVVAAYLSYNIKKIEAISIDLSDSIFEMIAEEEINKSDGKIKITLGKPTPGVKINNGKVATVYFRAKEKTHPYMENIYFSFTKGSSLFSTVILDDKKGTNILDDTSGAKIFID